MVSVIIVTYNSEQTIKDCLESVLGSQGEKEIIVVDNNSSDKTVEIVSKFSKVRFIKNKENFGFGKASNTGARQAKGEFLFFLNPDCQVEKDSIKMLESFLIQNKEIAVVGPKLINENGSLQREMSPFPDLLDQIIVLLRLHRFKFFSKFVYPNYNYEKTQEAEHLMGSALMIRRSVFEEVGGFDPNFFLWFEETDLLKRIKEKGYEVVYYPKARVKHLVGQSTKQINFLKKQTIWNRSLLYYFKKHENFVTILLILPFVLLSYPAALVSYLVKK